MLQRLNLTRGVRLPDNGGASDQTSERGLEAFSLLADVFGLILRESRLMIACVFLSILCALAYLVITPPVYKAAATITVEMRKAGLSLGDASGAASQEPESFVEVIKSGNISSKVVQELGLDKESEFASPKNVPSQMLQRARSLLGLPTRAVIPEPSQAMHQALTVFRANLEVKRVGPQAMEISFRSLDPERAARVVNAVVDAFIADQVEAAQLSAKSSGIWLQERLTKLRADAEAAQQAVVDFKKQNNVVEVDGKILNDQRLTEINTQLIAARIQRAELAAKLKSLREAISAGSEILVADIKPTDTLNRARQQLTDLVARNRDWTARYGAEHSAVVNLHTQIQNIRDVIAGEFGQLAAVYARDLEAAEAKQQALETAYADAVTLSYATSQLQVNLRELESTAQTYRTLHDAFLQRHTAAVQQESFRSSAARVLTRAEAPLYSSSPVILLVLGASLAAGSALGLMAGFIRERSCRVMRTPEQVARKMKAGCLGIVPIAEAQARSNALQRHESMFAHVLSEPGSNYTDAVRSIVFHLDRASGFHGAVIGVTSPSMGEGKSVTAANLADLLALSGRQTILVDCHLRSPALSERLAPGVGEGLLSVVLGQASLSESVLKRYTQADFLPAGAVGGATHLNELLGSPGMVDLLSNLRSTYHYIILDLPPVSNTSEARTAASFVDVVLMVVEWSKTLASEGSKAIRALQLAEDQRIGVVLNKVGGNAIKKLHAPGYPGAKPVERLAPVREPT